MLEKGGETVHARAEGQTTAFLSVYEGQGAFGAHGAAAKAGETRLLGPAGDIASKATAPRPTGRLTLLPET